MMKENTSDFPKEISSTLLSVPELADYLGIGKNRAHDLLRNGSIDGFKIGCTWEVSKTAVEKYIYENPGLI